MNPLIQQFGSEKRWVLWKLEERKGKKTKVPYTIAGRPASSTDESTWSTYEEAKDRFTGFSGLGIVFTQSQTLLGLDLDHILDEQGKLLNEYENIKPFLAEANTYTEVSPSKFGLHLFLELTAPLKLEANRKGNVECYTSGRFFTVTENPFGKAKPVRKVTPDEATALLSKLGYPWKSNPPLQNVTQDNILSHIFASKNGKKIEALYNGDLSQHDNDASKADAALLAHLAFWCAKDPLQMETIWLASPLGKREKTQKRKDYRDRTIAKAIANCTEVYETAAQKTERVSGSKKIEFLGNIGKDGDTIPKMNVENICRVLRSHPEFAGKLRYDLFKNVLEHSMGGAWARFQDSDAVRVQARIQTLYPPFMLVGKLMVYDAMIKVAKDNAIDSAADWLRSLVWDGVPRLDSWISLTYGTPDDAYHRAVGSNWMKGLVQRIIEPGCKFDHVLVLEGKQGIRKSTSLFVLGGSWHLETTTSTESKDFFLQFQGKAIIEFSEGETISHTEVKRMKSIISMQFDTFRPPYERTPQEFPRRCAFAMTTNEEEYLKDPTGGRRWLPVSVTREADIAWLTENRNQLFAEAYRRVIVLRETTYEFPEDELADQQERRQIVDPRSGLVYDWYWTKIGNAEREAGVSTRDAYMQGVQQSAVFGKEMGRPEETVMGSILKNYLKLERKQVMKAGLRSCLYYPTEESEALAPEEKNVESKLLPSLFDNHGN